MSGDAHAMFQAEQAAFSRLCLSSIVSPTERKFAAISEIISDILRLGEGALFFDWVMFPIGSEFTTGTARCPWKRESA